MIINKQICSVLTLTQCLVFSPVHASETAWFETDGGNVRIITEPFLPGATSVRGVIDIDLLPGWKTYWRDPGTGGIPPVLKVNKVDLISDVEIKFPAPEWIESKYGGYAGYDVPVQIPFILTANSNISEQDIAARLFIGICSDICIPAFTDFDLSITEATGSSRSAITVQNAFGSLPKTPADLNMSVETKNFDGQTFDVKIIGDVEDLAFFVSSKSGEQFNSPEIIEKTQEAIAFRVSPLDPLEDGKMVEVFLTGKNSSGAFETSEIFTFSKK